MRSAWISAALVIAIAGGCSKESDKGSKLDPGSGSAGASTASGSDAGKRPGMSKARQITPPFDPATPPADATKTASGLTYKKITTVADPAAKSPGKNDLVKVSYTGWKATGQTQYSTADKTGQPLQMSMQAIPPGFAEGLSLMKVGEKAFLWVPPEIGYREMAKPPKPEAMAYEVELVDIIPAAPVPPDLAKPPATAKKSAGGNAYVVLQPATGTESCRSFDTATFNLTVWDPAGNQLETTEAGPQKRPRTSPPFRESKGVQDMVTTLSPGERARFWVPPDQLTFRDKPKAEGLVTVEIELASIEKAAIEPPPVPKDVAAPPKDAKKTERGTFYKILKKGKPGGKQPVPSDTVSVHYTGWTTDGRMFDSSVIRGKPSEFPLTGVIQGWTDGIPQMHLGETARFWIPVELAYQNRPGKPAGMLVFDVELLDIKEGTADARRPEATGPAAPPDVAKPPDDAKKTDKGVFYKVITPAKTPGKQPGPTDTVKVHYSGWTTDGKLFDSSLKRGKPAEFALNQVIAGWTDGLQQMHVGDTTRFWIPVELAYNNQPGRPAGMLVFDVELLEVK